MLIDFYSNIWNMKQTRSLSEFSCLSEYTRLYSRCGETITWVTASILILFGQAYGSGTKGHFWGPGVFFYSIRFIAKQCL